VLSDFRVPHWIPIRYALDWNPVHCALQDPHLLCANIGALVFRSDPFAHPSPHHGSAHDYPALCCPFCPQSHGVALKLPPDQSALERALFLFPHCGAHDSYFVFAHDVGTN
jgi:hypothetical protein